MSPAYEKTIIRSAAFDRMVAAAKGQLQPSVQPKPVQQRESSSNTVVRTNR